MATLNAIAARAIPSTAASLGLGAQPIAPAAPAASVASPNASVPTGFSPTPAPAAAAVTPQVAAPNPAVATVAAQLGTTTNAVQSAQNVVASNFGTSTAAQFTNGAAGGGIGQAFASTVARIAAFAQNGMKSIEQAIQADMSANNGQVDPAKMQQYSMSMSTFETLMQMAAKMQEKQERAAQVWLR